MHARTLQKKTLTRRLAAQHVARRGVVVDEWTSPPRDPARTYRMLSLAEAERLVDAARALKSGTQPRSSTGADLLRCRITVFDDSGPRSREFDDVGLQGPERQILDLLVR